MGVEDGQDQFQIEVLWNGLGCSARVEEGRFTSVVIQTKRIYCSMDD